MKIKLLFRRFAAAFLLCLAIALPLLAAGPLQPALTPKTDWLTPEGWQMETFEPLGAISKRVRYTLNPTNHYILGFAKIVNGAPRRAYTEPILGSDIATPFNGTIELQSVIPITQRDFEVWIFPADPQ